MYDMVSKKQLVIMIWIVIWLLIGFNAIIQWRIEDFRDKCQMTYDNNTECPCNAHITPIIADNHEFNVSDYKNIIIDSGG